MAKKRSTLKVYQVNKSIFKGRLFEFLLAELLKKAGFTNEFETDQLTKDRRKLHGRGSTYAPDFYGVFKIGIPFVNPLLLIVEAKYFNKRVNIKTVREFLGAYIDFSQYIKIDTKSHKLDKKYEKLYETRFTYCPVFFSMKGYEKPAQAFMYAHGINYISYQNSTTILNMFKISEQLQGEINFSKFTQKDFEDFKSLSDIGKLRKPLKKDNFLKTYTKFEKFIKLLNSHIAIIDNKFTVNILHKGRLSASWFRSPNIEHETDGKFILKNNKDKTIGEFSLPKYFLKEYVTYAQKKGKLATIFQDFNIIISHNESFEVKTMHVSETSRTNMINAALGLDTSDDNEPEIETI